MKNPGLVCGNGGHYSIYKDVSMEILRNIFPEGEANEMNFVLFSTSGVHGTYITIEEVESDPELKYITCLVIQPRLVTMHYGEVTPETPDDFTFLCKLRKSSWDIVQKIGI